MKTKKVNCGKCGQPRHSSRTCGSKHQQKMELQYQKMMNK